MRTVHETEALRPSDPVPKNHSNPSTRVPRLRLILSAKPPDDSARTDEESTLEVEDDAATVITAADSDTAAYPSKCYEAYPAYLHLTDDEQALPPKKLFHLLSQQLTWAEEEGAELRAEVEALEQKAKDAWVRKELIMEDVLETEEAFHDLRAGDTSKERKLTIQPKRLPAALPRGDARFLNGEPNQEPNQEPSTLRPEAAST